MNWRHLLTVQSAPELQIPGDGLAADEYVREFDRINCLVPASGPRAGRFVDVWRCATRTRYHAHPPALAANETAYRCRLCDGWHLELKPRLP